MGDFFQNGVVTSLHRLSSRPIEALEAELTEFSRQRPMSLVLPSLFSELEGEALPAILEELAKVPYLSEIIIGLDRADASQFEYARRFFDKLPQPHRILWHDGPRLRELDNQLSLLGLAPQEPGKGRNVWYCYGYVIASGKADVIALHDCDILTYNREMPARLFYPVANPALNYRFCKGYYYRVANNQIHGRVTRLLLTPLVRALKTLIGPLDYLEFLDSFRYPLAGEFSMRVDVVREIRIPSDWGLEIGVLSEVHRNQAHSHFCQVEIADSYDHKHQPVSEDNPEAGLAKMSMDIAKSLYRKLATMGCVFHQETFRTLKATYYRVGLDFVDRYYSEARINGLAFDRHSEERMVELFAQNVWLAGEQFLENPMETPFIPSWNRVVSAIPDFLEQLYGAVEEDNR
ncbi:MAG: glycosyl transferase [Methylothermaceae bacteria B42]|nr:MAG: glycosyl transferase [Methylothermaceae bacteria B42]HHJ39559.1 glycosyl transferase [Methylothermaceae bacterium]